MQERKPWVLTSSSSLLGADLLGADLLGADLLGADLLGADLLGADLLGADLLGAPHDLLLFFFIFKCFNHGTIINPGLKLVMCLMSYVTSQLSQFHTYVYIYFFFFGQSVEASR